LMNLYLRCELIGLTLCIIVGVRLADLYYGCLDSTLLIALSAKLNIK
jgi:hypothetical protein